eukprot:401308_1
MALEREPQTSQLCHINSEENIEKDTKNLEVHNRFKYTPPNQDSKCGALIWNKNALIESKRYKSKSYIEQILNKKFDDEFFKKNINMLYAIFIQKIQHEQKNNIIAHELECTVLYDIYSLTNDHIDAFQYIPIKMNYFMFNRKFNTYQFIPSHLCDHNKTHSSSIHFINEMIKFMRNNNHKYTTKLELNDNHNIAEVFACSSGCCSECAELMTIPITDFCYKLHKISLGGKQTGKQCPAPLNIDTLSGVCIWLANVLQHKYIKISLKNNSDLMPTIFRTLYMLLKTAHFTYKDKLKLYMNIRDRISFAIWRLLKEIIINYKYIKKYYQKKDVSNNEYCESYIVEMLQWLMEEIEILGDILKEKNNSVSVLNSLKYDYFGGIIILMCLLKYDKSKIDILSVTHRGVIYETFCEWLTDMWMTIHLYSHDISALSQFFKKSILESRNLRKRNEIKCEWRKCRKWKACDKFYKCKGCRVAKYCSRNCQKKAWKLGVHAFVCRSYH